MIKYDVNSQSSTVKHRMHQIPIKKKSHTLTRLFGLSRDEKKKNASIARHRWFVQLIWQSSSSPTTTNTHRAIIHSQLHRKKLRALFDLHYFFPVFFLVPISISFFFPDELEKREKKTFFFLLRIACLDWLCWRVMSVLYTM